MEKINKFFKSKSVQIFAIIFFAFLIPRIVYLGYDTYGFDSYFWDQRSDRFVDTLTQFEFKKTYRSYHPGVTVMYLAGFSKAIFQNTLKIVFHKQIRLVEGVVEARWFFINHFVSLFPLVVAISLILGFISMKLYKLKIPKAYVALFTVLLSVEPFFLGISKFLHVTALETVLVFALFMSVYFITQDIKNKKIWILAGIFLGLGILTKISAIIALPFSALILYAGLLKKHNNLKSFLKEFKLDTKIFLVILAMGFFTMFILWPSLWVNFIGTFQKIYKDGIKGDAFNATPAPTILNITYLYYPEILLLRTTALTFISTVIAYFVVWKEKNKTLKSVVLINLLFIVYYFGIMTIPDKKLDRYINNVFPSVAISAAYSYYYILNFLHKRKKQVLSGIFLALLIFYYGINLYVYFPNFSAIHSEFFGGLSGYSKFIKVKNRGEYYLDAIMYLNKKDGIHADKILIVPSGGKDKSAKGYPGRIFTDDKQINNNGKANYYLPEYNDLQEIPTNRDCKLLKTFGPRWPIHFDYLYLYECKEK